MDSNQTVLARILALQAISEARRPHLSPPMERVMSALESAIEDKRTTVIDLAARGRFDAPEYIKAKAELTDWDNAWRSNR